MGLSSFKIHVKSKITKGSDLKKCQNEVQNNNQAEDSTSQTLQNACELNFKSNYILSKNTNTLTCMGSKGLQFVITGSVRSGRLPRDS